MGRGGDSLPVQLVDEKVTRAVTTVADGKAFACRVQGAPGETALDGGRRGIRGQAILKRIWGDQYMHPVNDGEANIRE